MYTVPLLFILLGVAVFLWLLSRERKRAAKGEPRLANWRLVFAAIFSMVALFSGGCSLLFIPDAIRGTQYIDSGAVLIIGGVPFAISALLLWLSLRRRKDPPAA